MSCSLQLLRRDEFRFPTQCSLLAELLKTKTNIEYGLILYSKIWFTECFANTLPIFSAQRYPQDLPT